MDKNDREQWIDVEEIDIDRYLGVFFRRRRIVATSILVCAITSLIYGLSSRPQYRATTTLQIERDVPKILNFDELFQAEATTDFYQTQYRLIASETLARRVIEQQDLLQPPATEPSSEEAPGIVSSVLGGIRSLPSQGVGLIRRVLGTAPPAPDASTPEPDVYAPLVDEFLGKLSIAPVPGTQLVEVSWTDPNPARAAEITNVIAETYIALNLEAKFETAEQASQFLVGEIGRLRDEIDELEAAMQAYGRERDILSLDERQDTVTQALADLSAEFTRAQTDRVQKHAYYEQLRDSDPGSIPEVFTNSLILNMKSDRTDLERQYSEMSQRFTDDWPAMRRLRVQITEATDRVAAEEQRIFDSLVRNAENAYEGATARENRVNTLLEAQRDEAMSLNRNLVTYRSLQVELDNKRNLLDSLLARQSETGVSARLQGMRTSNVRVVDPAIFPRFPYKPSLRLNLVAGLMAGALIGTALAFAKELIDNTLTNPDEVESRTGLPCLGTIPSLDSTANAGRRGTYGGGYFYGYGDDAEAYKVPHDARPEFVTHEHPRSILAEGYREIRTSVLLSSPAKPPNVILVTSSMPGEGKTTSALNLAISMAHAGKRVLIIDADLRRPRLHDLLELDPKSGLVNFLSGNETQLKGIVHPTVVENLWALPCGPTPPNPAELLSSERAAHVFKTTRDAFDLVIVDSAPVLAVVDPLVIVNYTDGAILVVRGGSTAFQSVQRAARKIAEVRGRILGVALNGVDINQQHYGGAYGKPLYRSPDASSEGGFNATDNRDDASRVRASV